MAQSVKGLTSAQVMSSRFMSSSHPHRALCCQRGTCLGSSASLSLPLSNLCSISLSQKKINNTKKKKKRSKPSRFRKVFYLPPQLPAGPRKSALNRDSSLPKKLICITVHLCFPKISANGPPLSKSDPYPSP